MANPQNLKPFTGADDPRRANGPPKGTKHISTWIQEMLNDEEFETTLLDSKKGITEYKGAPLKAIIGVAIHKSIHDKDKGNIWAEWLAKHGYGTLQRLEINDPRKDLLERYMGGDSARKTEEAESRPPTDPA